MMALGGIFEDSPSGSNADSASTSSVTAVGATPDEVRQIVQDAIADYETRMTEDTATRDAAYNDKFLVLQDSLAENHDLIVGVGDDVSKAATGVVTISDDQWRTMQECWGWAKSCAAVALFLALVATLLVAALFGSKLWDHFSKGWRR